jgi:hypothetical protein
LSKPFTTVPTYGTDQTSVIENYLDPRGQRNEESGRLGKAYLERLRSIKALGVTLASW